jgi:hypothetical protein
MGPVARLAWGFLLIAGCGSDQDFVSFVPDKTVPVVPPPESMGSWLSFDRSPEGERITMSYYDKDEGALGWALGGIEDDGSITWAHERVDGYAADDELNAGKYSSQKTAPDGTVWVAYQDVDSETLRVAHRTNPGVWEILVVDGAGSAPGVGHWISLALDAQGHPVIAHCDAASGAVRVTRTTDGKQFTSAVVYTSQKVVEASAEVGYTSLFIVGASEYLAFQDVATGALHLLRGTGGSYADEVVDSGGVGAWPSVWADAAGQVRIAYQDVASQHLKYAEQAPGGSWSVEVVDGADLRGADTALIDRGGEPTIVYFDGYNNDQWLASRANGAWSTAKVAGDEGAVGYHNEVVIVGGRLFAGSYDYTADGLSVKAL